VRILINIVKMES